MLYVVIFMVLSLWRIDGALVRSPTFILVDGTNNHISSHCRRYCKEYGVRFIQIFSPLLCELCKNDGIEVPKSLIAPVTNEDILDWALNRAITVDSTEADVELNNTDALIEKSNLYLLSATNAGIITSDKILSALNLTESTQVFLSENTVDQQSIYSIDDVLTYADRLWDDSLRIEQKVLLKSSSDDIKMRVCQSKQELMEAYDIINKNQEYQLNAKITIEEYIEGPEYLVDSVTHNSSSKIASIWKCHYATSNDSPFVRHCTELISAAGNDAQEICTYCLNYLQSLGVKQGPFSFVVKYTKKGPRIVKMKSYWQSLNAVPITTACLGYDAISSTLDAFFRPERFNELPKYPCILDGSGRIVHLVNTKKGKIKSINHLEEIQALESILSFNIDSVGDNVEKTIDLSTSCGSILLYHKDPSVVERDYQKIKELEHDMLTMWGEEEGYKQTVRDKFQLYLVSKNSPSEPISGQSQTLWFSRTYNYPRWGFIRSVMLNRIPYFKSNPSALNDFEVKLVEIVKGFYPVVKRLIYIAIGGYLSLNTIVILMPFFLKKWII